MIISGYNVINTEYINTYETRIEMIEAKNLSFEGLRNNKKGGVIPMGEEEAPLEMECSLRRWSYLC